MTPNRAIPGDDALLPSPFGTYISELFNAFPGLKSLGLLSSHNSPHIDLTNVVSEYALLLNKLRVPGPAELAESGHGTKIGSGAQFTVRKRLINGVSGPGIATVGHTNSPTTVAVKIPHFSPGGLHKLDISDRTASSQVREIILEITALCHPQIQKHRNIVDLLAWGISSDDWHNMPFIALELANDTLFGMLYSWRDMPVPLKHHISLDIGNALDAIHGIGLVHGDLKPDNVLMFDHAGVWVAKLADFAGAGNLAEGGVMQGRGTVGWRAPEFCKFLEGAQVMDLAVLDMIDNYTYGLLVWTIFLKEGGFAPCDEDSEALQLAQVDLEFSHSKLPRSLCSALGTTFESTLALQPRVRTKKVGSLLNEGSRVYHGWETLSGILETTYDMSKAHDSRFDWEIPEVSLLNVEALKAAYLKRQKLSPDMLYAVAIKLLAYGRRLLRDTIRKDFLLEIVTVAAQQGHRPSQSLIHRLYDFFQHAVPIEVVGEKLLWISGAVASGALFLANELQYLDADMFKESLQRFHASGGYNCFYAPIHPEVISSILEQPILITDEHFTVERALNPRGDRLLHLLASTNHPEALSELLGHLSVEEINTKNNNGETALYRACMAGITSNVFSLLSSGADPSITTMSDGPTCLHWLFHFARGDIDIVADKLIERGCSVNVVSSQDTVMLYYPFVFPRGTPLHWAVHMSVREAVDALLRHRAIPSIRNGIDPYAYDECVRELELLLPPDLVRYSTSETLTQGLSSIDMAVQNHDHEILALLLAEESNIDPNDADEEGYTALHRLDAGEWTYTMHGSAIWNPLVQGSQEAERDRHERTIATLVRQGFDLDKLTKPVKQNVQPNRFYGQTALMLAVSKGNPNTVEFLLSAGAEVDVVNDEGRSALLLLSDNYSDDETVQSRIVSLLLAANADIHLRDIHGDTPILRAAASKLQAAMEILLAHGANICDRVTDPTSYHFGWNVLSYAAHCPLSEAVTYDKWFTSILTQYLLPLLKTKDEHKTREESIERADLTGGSLLHYVVSGGLVQSCAILLKVRAQVNALQESERFRYREQRWLKITSYYTPLDKAFKAFKRQNGDEARSFSKEDYDKQLAVFTDIIKLLEDAGAVRGKELTTKRVTPSDAPAKEIMTKRVTLSESLAKELRTKRVTPSEGPVLLHNLRS